MKKARDEVSVAVIRRLPRYFRQLNDLYEAGIVRISSNALGESMGLTASQIRQDLSCFGEFGQQGYGYNVEKLRAEVASILGMNEGYTAILLGAGNLGRALIQNFHFERSGFRLMAAFDVDERIVGGEISGVPILHIDTLERYMQENEASVGVLTVPGRLAGEMAERLVDGGVRGIWNFTNTELDVDENKVVVENVHFADSLLALSYMISE